MITQIDFKILDFIQTLRSPILDKVFAFITHLGDKGYIWIAIALIMLCFKKKRKCGIIMAIALILGTLIGNITLKNLFGRLRPFQVNTSMKDMLIISAPGGFSFPSGHTLSSFECAFAIFFHNKKMGIPALILATLIGFSRNYLYVHYPTDVIAGIILGLFIAVLSSFLYKKFIKDKKIGKIQL